VTSIGERGAFYGCNGLISITLPFIGASRTATGASAVFGFIFLGIRLPRQLRLSAERPINTTRAAVFIGIIIITYRRR
jgi:hypothetical protein